MCDTLTHNNVEYSCLLFGYGYGYGWINMVRYGWILDMVDAWLIYGCIFLGYTYPTPAKR